MKYPDYDQSLLALTSSILSHYDVKTKHKSLSQLDRSDGFIGDYLAIAISNISIAYEPTPYKAPFKGVHAGLTEDSLDQGKLPLHES